MRDFIGTVKDKLTLSKLTLLSNPNTSHLHIAVLRTTSHSPSTPPNPNHHHLATLLSLGDTSRATASVIIRSLFNRLHHTNNSYVALKCLLTIHHIIKRRRFILTDQLSVLPSAGGRNNLKLSDFRDGASRMLSVWVRWYARYIETINFNSKSMETLQNDSISSFVNSDLILGFGSLVDVIEEICKVPIDLQVERDMMVIRCVMELVAIDYLSTVNEMLVRVSEFKERVNLLSFNDSVELASGLERLTNCKEKLFELFSMKKVSVERLWEMIEELNSEFGMVKFEKPGKRIVGLCGSESARLCD